MEMEKDILYSKVFKVDVRLEEIVESSENETTEIIPV